MKIPNQPGNYLIVGALKQEEMFSAKSFEKRILPKGIYFYCGAAHGPGGLRARIRRHLNPQTVRFWHFDYLKDRLAILEVWWQVDEHNRECESLHALADLPGAVFPIAGFGAGDCSNRCPAHLVCFPAGSDLNIIFVCLHKNGLSFEREILESG